MSTPTPPPLGSLCRAHTPGAHPRLVLVTAHRHPIVVVRLLTNEIEMATNTEALLPATPDRPYDLLAHEFPGYLLPQSLSAPLSQIDLDADLHEHPALPLVSRTDPRWAWKLAELHATQALQPPLSVVLSEPPPPGVRRPH